MKTADRLGSYGVFDEEVISSIADVAKEQNERSFAELTDRFDVGDGPMTKKIGGRVLQVLEIVPKGDFDESQATVLHLPHSNQIGDHVVVAAMRLAAASPGMHLMLVGNASSLGSRAGTLPLADIRRVWGCDLEPTVQPTLQYLDGEGITFVDHLGYSFGADKATLGATVGHEQYGHTVGAIIAAEPATLIPRSLNQLGRAFGSVRLHQQEYIDAADSRPLDEAWDKGGALDLLKFVGGMARLTNIAIAAALTQDNFKYRASAALSGQPDVRMTVAWGTASELVPDEAAGELVEILQAQHGSDRIQPLAIPGMHHAGADDVDLFAAIMLQGLKPNSAN